MELILSRESVCAGDDAVPHFVRLDLPDGATLVQLMELVGAAELHHVDAGGPTTWLLRVGVRGRPLAAVRRHEVAWIADPGEPVTTVVTAEDSSLLYLALQSHDSPGAVRAAHLPPGAP